MRNGRKEGVGMSGGGDGEVGRGGHGEKVGISIRQGEVEATDANFGMGRDVGVLLSRLNISYRVTRCFGSTE